MKIENYIKINIKKIRKVKNLNQAQFAELFGISRASVGAYEEGRADPKIETLQKISNKFSIDLGDLIGKPLTVNDINGFKQASAVIATRIPVFLSRFPLMPSFANSEERWLLPSFYQVQFVLKNELAMVPYYKAEDFLLWRSISAQDLLLQTGKLLFLVVNDSHILGELKEISNGMLYLDSFVQSVEISFNDIQKSFVLSNVINAV